jgi:hypothetical protein
VSRVFPPQTLTVDLTTQQKELLTGHFHAVPSQGVIFAQVWPTHIRVAVYDNEEAKRIAKVLIEIATERRARSAGLSDDI